MRALDTRAIDVLMQIHRGLGAAQRGPQRRHDVAELVKRSGNAFVRDRGGRIFDRRRCVESARHRRPDAIEHFAPNVQHACAVRAAEPFVEARGAEVATEVMAD